jgi:zinc-ribbon domain
MSASPIPGNVCRSCGEELAPSARFCPNCGTSVAEPGPSLETVPGPVVHGRVEARWLGMPARFALLCLGFAGFGAAIGLFATGSWAWGVVALFIAAILLAGLWEATHRAGEGDPWTERSSRIASDGRAHAATAAEIWRTRLDASVSRWRTRSRLDQIEIDRRPALQRLGEAVWRDDSDAEQEARQRLVELEEKRWRAEDELAERLAGAEERIRRARLPVQDTQMSAGSVRGKAADARLEDPGAEGPRGPDEPNAPYPPPDEGNPPEPAQVPEPYPPPDEGTPPVPAPDPGQTESE